MAALRDAGSGAEEHDVNVEIARCLLGPVRGCVQHVAREHLPAHRRQQQAEEEGREVVLEAAKPPFETHHNFCIISKVPLPQSFSYLGYTDVIACRNDARSGCTTSMPLVLNSPSRPP